MELEPRWKLAGCCPRGLQTSVHGKVQLSNAGSRLQPQQKGRVPSRLHSFSHSRRGRMGTLRPAAAPRQRMWLPARGARCRRLQGQERPASWRPARGRAGRRAANVVRAREPDHASLGLATSPTTLLLSSSSSDRALMPYASLLGTCAAAGAVVRVSQDARCQGAGSVRYPCRRPCRRHGAARHGAASPHPPPPSAAGPAPLTCLMPTASFCAGCLTRRAMVAYSCFLLGRLSHRLNCGWQDAQRAAGA